MVSAMGSGGSILRLNKYKDRLLMVLSGHSGEWVMPKASSVGFTGTPIESGDKNTQAMFGDLGGVPNTCEFDSL